MTNQGPPNRPSLWEEEAPAETPLRRVRPVAPAAEAGRAGAGRVLPGMPLEFDDNDDEDEAPRKRRPRASRFDEPKMSWWRPASKTGRVILSVSALVVLGGLTVAGLKLRTYLERDARFRVVGSDNIQATGLNEVGREELLPVFGEDMGRNIFFVPLNTRRKQLEQISWVERATVMRLLPDQIRVSIVERKPVAFTRSGNQIELVDANGVLLSMPAAAMAQHHYSFPVLTGIDPGDSAESRKTRVAVYMRMMSELDAGGQHNSEQLSEIDLTDPEDARVTMPEQGRDILAHFGEDRFLERYQRYKSHIAEWRQQYPNLSAVDLRYDQQVVLQMSSGTEAAAGTPAAADNAGSSDAQEEAAKPKPAASKATAEQKSSAAKPDAKKTPAKPVAKTAGGSAAAKKKPPETKKIADTKKAADGKKTADVKKAATAKKTADTRKIADAKKDTDAKKSAAAKKPADSKKTADTKKATLSTSQHKPNSKPGQAAVRTAHPAAATAQGG